MIKRKLFLLPFLSLYSFFYSILRWSVAVSTMRRQSSRIAAFLQANARPMFCWPRSASTARSQVWLGLPDGRFQSGGSRGAFLQMLGEFSVHCRKYIDKPLLLLLLRCIVYGDVMGFSPLREQQFHKTNLIVRLQILFLRIQYNAVSSVNKVHKINDVDNNRN